MSDVTDDDLRDVFRLLYDGDEWASDGDGEDEVGEAGSGGNAAGDNGTRSKRDAGEGGMEAEQTLSPAPDTPGAMADIAAVEAEVAVPTTQERYTRKRFLDSLASLLVPSPKRARVYIAPPLPSSPSRPSLATTHLIPSTSPLPLLPPLPSTSRPDLTTTIAYEPFSPLSLLARLRTFRASTYPSLPIPLRPTRVALGGWRNTGRNELGCDACGARCSVQGVLEIGEKAVREEVARRLGERVRVGHIKGCPWSVMASPDTLLAQLRRMLHPPLASSLDPLASALAQECDATDGSIAWKSPLSPAQSQSLVESLTRHASLHPIPSPPTQNSTSTSVLAAHMALFAWYPYHPNAPPGVVPSSSSSSTNPKLPPRDASRAAHTDIVQCRLCERRVGLWAFRAAPRSEARAETSAHRSFDLLGEHLEWCSVRPQPSLDAGTGMRSDGAAWWTELAMLGQGGGVVEIADMPPSEEAEGAEGALREQPRVKAKRHASIKGWVVVSEKLERKPWRR